MSAAHQSWLERVPEFGGLLAAYATAPHAPPEARSWSADYPPEAVRAIHRHVLDVVGVLAAGQMPTRKLRWIFEQAVVYFEQRRDGAGMCLITTHEPWTGEGEIITRLIADFRNTP